MKYVPGIFVLLRNPDIHQKKTDQFLLRTGASYPVTQINVLLKSFSLEGFFYLVQRLSIYKIYFIL